MRLVPVPPEKLNDAQRQLFDSIVAFTRAQNPRFAIADEQGALVSPFNPMLHSPHFGNAAPVGSRNACATCPLRRTNYLPRELTRNQYPV